MERDTHRSASASAEELCYLSAGHVESPGGTLAELNLCSRDHESVGTVDGVLIDAPARRVRYFVVQFGPVADRFLLPVDAIGPVDAGTHVAHIETANANLRLMPFDPHAARPFSGDDALAAMFSSVGRAS